MAYDFLFKDLASQLFDKNFIVIERTTTFSWIFIDKDIFSKNKTQSQTSDHFHLPISAVKSRELFWKWYQKIDIKDASFALSSHDRVTGYSDVVT